MAVLNMDRSPSCLPKCGGGIFVFAALLNAEPYLTTSRPMMIVTEPKAKSACEEFHPGQSGAAGAEWIAGSWFNESPNATCACVLRGAGRVGSCEGL